MKISGCLIVKNEENNIENCINSYKKIVNEIILVDTGSSDNTIKIARKLGAKIFYYKWDDNFSNARNYAISKAKGYWILFLDADEYFSSPLDASFLVELQRYNKRPDILGLAFKHVNVDINTGKKSEEQYLIRMFRNKKNIRYKNSIHEYIANSNGEMVVDIIKNKELIIYHTGYSKDILKEKVQRNLNLILKDLDTKQDTPMTYFYLSDCYLNLNKYSKCIENAKKFLSTGQKTLGFDVKPYFNIIDSMFSLDKPFSEINYEIDGAICKFPSHPEFYNFKARLYLNNKMYDEALKYYNMCLNLQNNYDDIQINNMNSQFESICFNMGKIFLLKNNIENAFDCFIKVLNYNLYNEIAFRHILKIVKTQKAEDIIALINSIYHIDSKKDMEFIVRNLCSCKYGIVLAYYANVWRNNFNIEDSSIMFNFLANKNYDTAFQCFYKCFKEDFSDWTELYTVVSAVLSQKRDNYELILNSINDSYKRIILNYFGFSKKLLCEDVEEYLEILTEFLLIDEYEQIKRYAALKENFEEDISEKIGYILSDYGFYQLAIEQYSCSINSENYISSLFKLGASYYNIKNYNQALICFEQALKEGYVENDILEYINWISTLMNKDEIISKCSNLTKLYKNLQGVNNSTSGTSKNRLLIYGKDDLIPVINKIINTNFEVASYIDDNNYNSNIFMDKPVIDISEVVNFKFDYIINLSNYTDIINYGVSDDKIIDLKKWIEDFFDYEFYQNYFNDGEQDETIGIISGISYHEVGIDVDYLRENFVNLAVSGEDLYYNYLKVKDVINSGEFSNLKYCIIGLTPYSFQYDLSLTESEFGKKRPNIYYSFYKDYHNYKNKEGLFCDNFKIKANKVLTKHYKTALMKSFRYDFEKKWNRMIESKFNSKKLSRKDLENEVKRIKDEGNKHYPITLNENYNILIQYIQLLIENNIKPMIVICPVTDFYKDNFSKCIYDEFLDLICSIQCKFNSELQVLNYYGSNSFEESYFYDSSHLNIYGAEKFTRLLNENIDW